MPHSPLPHTVESAHARLSDTTPTQQCAKHSDKQERGSRDGCRTPAVVVVHHEDRKRVEEDAEDDVEGVANEDRAPHPVITRSDTG